MITVRLFGLLRLDTGVKELELEAGSVRALYVALPEALRRCGGAAIPAKMFKGCAVIINGAPGKISSKLQDGDEVMLLPPVCGG